MRSGALRMRFCVEEAGVELDGSRGPATLPADQRSQLQLEDRGGGLIASRDFMVEWLPRLRIGKPLKPSVSRPSVQDVEWAWIKSDT
jgi:hypothetical protein